MALNDTFLETIRRTLKRRSREGDGGRQRTASLFQLGAVAFVLAFRKIHALLS